MTEIEDFVKWINDNDLKPYISVCQDDLELLTHLDLSKKEFKRFT